MPTISERALGIKEMPEHERPLSERYRLAGEAWVEAKYKRDRIKLLKNTVFEREKNRILDEARGLGERITKADATSHIEASSWWEDYLLGLVEAEKECELAWVQCQELEMMFSEWQSREANARRERQMGRQAT